MTIFDTNLNGLWYTLGLVAIFGVIVLAVILVKKYVKPFKNDEKPKSDKEIAEEEVKRMVVDVDPETQAEMDKAAAEMAEKTKKENAPEEKEVVAEEVNRATRPVEDPKTAKQMAQYAEEHPEEAAAAQKAENTDKK
jgi:flagellar biosynthesis/type III secretory pathway M-ring protein FliF/YscJ